MSGAASVVVASTLLLVAWGTFAFGAVYSWAFAPLAAGSALVGLLALITGSRPAWNSNRLLLLSILGIGLLAAGQLIPLPLPLLSRLSPGTIAFFSRIDFRFSLPPDAAAEAGLAVLRHPISVAPEKTMLFLGLLAASLLLFVGLLRTLSRTANLRFARGIVFTGFALAMVAILQKAILGDDA